MNRTMSKTTSTTHKSYRVTASPGKSEYNRQLRRQRLWAVDAMLALWFVRIAFGVSAILAVGALRAFWQDASVVNVSLLGATLCDASCRISYPAEGTEFRRCMECCVYFSCRHHRGTPQLNLMAIPTRPCWKYDPELRRFVWDRTYPRCAQNRR
jgi:hypothetical protein